MFNILIFTKETKRFLININVKVLGQIFSITRFLGNDPGNKMELE